MIRIWSYFDHDSWTRTLLRCLLTSVIPILPKLLPVVTLSCLLQKKQKQKQQSCVLLLLFNLLKVVIPFHGLQKSGSCCCRGRCNMAKRFCKIWHSWRCKISALFPHLLKIMECSSPFESEWLFVEVSVVGHYLSVHSEIEKYNCDE